MIFWLFQCTLWILGNADNTHHVRGIPGVDYPNYETIPQTSFRCSEQTHIPGLYADPETGCQMFHHCYEHRHESFLCPPGTIFNQAILACDYWYSAECSELHNRDDSSHKVVSFEHETDFVPKETFSVNVFDKMASLYEFKEPSSKKFRSDDSGLETINHFSDDHILGTHTNMFENEKYQNSYLEAGNLHDRREGVLIESEFSSTQEKNNENDLRTFEDSFTDFESSGESEDVFVTDNLLFLNGTEEHTDFEKQYFAYNDGDYSEHHAKYNSHENNENSLLIDSYTNLAEKRESSSKEDFESADEFVKRQSESNENPNNKRKTKRRKPIFTIQSEEEFGPLIVSEKLTDDTKISSNDHGHYPTSSLKESIPELKSFGTPAPKRRKPILIDLEDLPQYNVDNGQNVPDGTRTSSINYEVNLKSKIHDFPIAAEEISVKLFPSKVKHERKPVNGYSMGTTGIYNVESDQNVELSSLNNLESLVSNIYDATSTLTTLKDIDRFEDDSMNLASVYPKRKKNIIRIIDSENDYNVENKESTDSTIYTTEFEDEVTTQSLNENFEGFDDFLKSNINYDDDEKEHKTENYYVEDDAEEFEDSHTFIPPYTHIEVSDGEGGTYFTEINPDIDFNINKYEGESDSEDGDNSINPKSLQNFEENNYEEHDSHVTTELPISEISTQKSPEIRYDEDATSQIQYDATELPISEISTHRPHEIQYGEDTTSHMYFIPNNDAQTTFDYLGSTETIPNLFSETLDENHDVRESLMNNFESNPSYETSVDISYELLDNSKTKYEVTDYFNSENDVLQNLLKQLPSYAYETNENSNFSHNSEFGESNLDSEGKILNANVSQNITHVQSALSKGENEEYDPLLDTELQEYLVNENSNFENNFNSDLAKDIHTESSVTLEEDFSSKYNLNEQYYSYDPIIDMDTLDEHYSMQNEQELIYQTVPLKFESDHNAYLSDEPITPDTLENIKQESIVHKDDEFDEIPNFEDSSIDFDDIQTENLDEHESNHAITSVDAFETQKIPSHLQGNSFNLKSNINSKTTAKDASDIGIPKFISSTESNKLSNGHSNLVQNIPASIKTAKDDPVRNPRAFMSRYPTENILFEAFDSQNFENLPYSLLKLKQSGMRRVLPDSMHGYGLEGMTYSTRTGNLLKSPKISKLISIGKNLLRAKQAKFRILGKYTNYFQTDQ